ncbi:pyruvate dehydrogenase protein X component isoform X2 [Hyalella azteca]|uniref:Dihydrolipoamide acetyltransferase component of pyruvate dehydrogenase complex n=1 Tax=Hyalella azteca TaxID=294128 RepID=A0A8B7PNY8_HYAAZ|nr:pyruvate dehydrogenase protein X component isoform X2 [Hyalella azteca]
MQAMKVFIRLSNLSSRRSQFHSRILGHYLHQSCCVHGEGIPLKMPSLSPTMVEGKIVKWFKKEGDPIEPGDVLCDIETDKAVVSFETDEEGTLAKILVDQTNDLVKIGTLIAVLAPEGEDWKTIEIPVDATCSPPSAPSVNVDGIAIAVTQPSSGIATSDIRKFGPSVRLLLQEYGLSADQIVKSGPRDVLLKGDVLNYIQSTGVKKVKKTESPVKSTPAAAAKAAEPEAIPSTATYSDVDVSNMRRAIAKRLLQSKSGTAHSYATMDCCIDALLALRRKLKKDGIAVSLNDFVVKAVAMSLLDHPALNKVWRGAEAVVSPSVDVSVAVATPSGLITPIVRDADRLGVKEISNTIRELAGRAKINKLKPEEFEGGSFSISNLGMFGIREFTAVINPPQCGILAVGSGAPVLNGDGVFETRMRATLSYDRLVVDDAEATEFLATLAKFLEDPTQMLLGVREARTRSVHLP